MEVGVSFKINDVFDKKLIDAIEIGLTKANIIIMNDAKAKCPVNKKAGKGGGALKNSIKRKIEKDLYGMRGVIYTAMEYAEYVEFPTRAHVIEIKKAKVLSDGKSFFGKKVKHPGTKAQPFMRPALLDNKNKALSIISNEMKKAK